VGRRSHRSGTGYSVYPQTEIARERKEGTEMRTPTILIILMSVMVVVFAGVALAKVINGNDNDNRLVGTPRNDTIDGKGGDDNINGRNGNDTLILGSGEDIVHGGEGNDFIRAVDRSKDDISCGPGLHDRVRANPGDIFVNRHGLSSIYACEKVIREGIRVN
jgi:Ca2+-binding RTX toxin-like protein